MNSGKTWILKILGGFFGLMLLCTVISRAAASVIVPQVTTGKIKEGKLVICVEGSGVIGTKQTRMVALPSGVRIQETKGVGEKVKKGDALLVCDMDYLNEQLELKQAEIKKMRLQLEGQKLSGTADVQVPATESASRAWNRAQEQLNDARAELEDARKDAKNGKQKLKQKLDAAKKAAEEKRKAAKNTAARNFEAAKKKAEMQKAQQEEADRRETEQQSAGAAEMTQTEAENAGTSEGESTQAANIPQSSQPPEDSNLTSQAQQEYEQSIALAQQEYEQSIAQAQQEYEQDVAQAKQTYKAALAELEGSKTAALQKVDSLKDASAQAEDALEIAGMQDAGDAQNRDKAVGMNELEQQSTQIDLELLEKEAKKLEKLLSKKGVISAPEDGVVQKNPTEAGMITSGAEVILLGYGGYQLNAVLDKEDFLQIREGDNVEISIPGYSENLKTAVGQIKTEEENAVFTADMEQEWLTYGAEAAYVIEKDSEAAYEIRIPITALREDMKGTYCLVMEEGSTVLGTEYTARRVNVTVEAKDASYAAVAGNLGRNDLIITGSNKSIAEGDRVRKAE